MPNRGCVTPRQIQNLKDTIDDNLDYLDGYDEITSDMQAKVRQALEDGHVADEEWRGVSIALARSDHLLAWIADLCFNRMWKSTGLVRMAFALLLPRSLKRMLK